MVYYEDFPDGYKPGSVFFWHKHAILYGAIIDPVFFGLKKNFTEKNVLQKMKNFSKVPVVLFGSMDHEACRRRDVPIPSPLIIHREIYFLVLLREMTVYDNVSALIHTATGAMRSAGSIEKRYYGQIRWEAEALAMHLNKVSKDHPTHGTMIDFFARAIPHELLSLPF
jgi:hypothetical protein